MKPFVEFSNWKYTQFYYLCEVTQIIYGLGILTLVCLKTIGHAIPRFRTQEACTHSLSLVANTLIQQPQ